MTLSLYSLLQPPGNCIFLDPNNFLNSVFLFTQSLYVHLNVGDNVSQQQEEQQSYNRVYMDPNTLGNKLEFKRSWTDSQHLFRDFNSKVFI
jgi:hypothetical protein